MDYRETIRSLMADGAAKAGNQTALAKHLGVHLSTVTQNLGAGKPKSLGWEKFCALVDFAGWPSARALEAKWLFTLQAMNSRMGSRRVADIAERAVEIAPAAKKRTVQTWIISRWHAEQEDPVETPAAPPATDSSPERRTQLQLRPRRLSPR